MGIESYSVWCKIYKDFYNRNNKISAKGFVKELILQCC